MSKQQGFWYWMNEEDGWKAFASGVYLIICIFDFIIVPSYIGITRPGLSELGMSVSELIQLDPLVQIEILNSLTTQHEPFTLQGGGLFHVAFGALLTGTAIVGKRGLGSRDTYSPPVDDYSQNYSSRGPEHYGRRHNPKEPEDYS